MTGRCTNVGWTYFWKRVQEGQHIHSVSLSLKCTESLQNLNTYLFLLFTPLVKRGSLIKIEYSLVKKFSHGGKIHTSKIICSNLDRALIQFQTTQTPPLTPRSFCSSGGGRQHTKGPEASKSTEHSGDSTEAHVCCWAW